LAAALEREQSEDAGRLQVKRARAKRLGLQLLLATRQGKQLRVNTREGGGKRSAGVGGEQLRHLLARDAVAN